MGQKTKYIINTVLWNLICTVQSGAVLQTFLLEKGISESEVGQYVAVMQFVQMGVIFLFSHLVDRIGNIIRSTALIHLLYLPFLCLCLLCCFRVPGNYTLLLFFGILANISMGMYNVLSYKLPYHIMDMKEYGRWTGAGGTVAGVFLFAFSVFLTFFQKKLGYLPAMRYIFIATLLGSVLFVFMTLSYRPVKNRSSVPTAEKINLLAYKPFLLLIIPNLLRGFAAGVVSLAVTVGYFAELLDAASAGILLIITQTVSIPANLIYTRISHRNVGIILFGSLGMAVSLSLMTAGGTLLFLAAYGVCYFAMMFVNVSVPVLVTRIVPYRVVGQYNGLRMLIHTGGIFLASAVCVPLMKALGATPTLILAGVCQGLCGICYYFYCKKYASEEK